MNLFLVVRDCEKMTSVRHDLIPHLVRRQFPSQQRLARSRSFWRKPRSDDDHDLGQPERLFPIHKENGASVSIYDMVCVCVCLSFHFLATVEQAAIGRTP